MTKIRLSCRETIDNVFYEHSFVREWPCSTETERFTIGHDTLMHALGHSDDCRLVCSAEPPDLIVARDGGDRVAALVYDLSVIAAPVLREPCEKFEVLIRRGRRAYSVT